MNKPLTPEERQRVQDQFLQNASEFFASKNKDKSRKPYYTEEHALAVRDNLDKLWENPKADRTIPLGRRTITTIRCCWYQGYDYLTDHLDPEGRYNKMRAHVKTYSRADALQISYDGLAGHSVLASSETPQDQTIVQVVEEFIETAEPGNMLRRHPVLLTANEVEKILFLLTPLARLFTFAVSTNVLQIARKLPGQK